MDSSRVDALRLVATETVRLGTRQRAGSHPKHSLALGYLEKAQMINRVLEQGYDKRKPPREYAEITDRGREWLAQSPA